MKSEIFKKIIAFTILFSTLFMGLEVLCVGWVIYCIIDLYVITLYTRRLLPAITFKNEMRVLVPILLRALSMGGVVYLLNYAYFADRLGRTTWMCPLYGYLLINSVRGNTLLD